MFTNSDYEQYKISLSTSSKMLKDKDSNPYYSMLHNFDLVQLVFDHVQVKSDHVHIKSDHVHIKSDHV